MSHVDQFNEFARKLSTDIITWARPEGWGPSITEVQNNTPQNDQCIVPYLNVNIFAST